MITKTHPPTNTYLAGPMLLVAMCRGIMVADCKQSPQATPADGCTPARTYWR